MTLVTTIRLSLVATLAAIAGCASTQLVQLNDPSTSELAQDVIPLDPSDSVPYQTKELAQGLSVGYNLFFSNNDNFPGYRLTLIFHNSGSEPIDVVPQVTLRDSRGIELQLADVREVATRAASLAGEPLPATFLASQPTSYYSTGVITNTYTGDRYTYAGYSSPANGGFAGGFASGMAQGAALGAIIRARRDQDDGRQVLQLISSYWLKSRIELEPGAAAVGVLYYPAQAMVPLPIKIAINGGALGRLAFITRQ